MHGGKFKQDVKKNEHDEMIIKNARVQKMKRRGRNRQVNGPKSKFG